MIFKCLEFTNQTQGLGRDQVMDINRLPDSLVANMYRVTRKRIHRSDEPFAKIESRQVATCSWRKKTVFSLWSNQLQAGGSDDKEREASEKVQ